MKDVAGAADRVDVPDYRVVLAHFEGDAVGEGAAVEGHESRCLGGCESGGGEEVGDLGVPDGVVGVGGCIWRGDVGGQVLRSGVVV